MRSSISQQFHQKLIDIDIFLAALNSRFGRKIEEVGGFAELTQEEILYGHTLLHLYFSKLQGKDIYRGWTKENVVFIHRKIVAEMEKRALEHTYNDALDDI